MMSKGKESESYTTFALQYFILIVIGHAWNIYESFVKGLLRLCKRVLQITIISSVQWQSKTLKISITRLYRLRKVVLLISIYATHARDAIPCESSVPRFNKIPCSFTTNAIIEQLHAHTPKQRGVRVVWRKFSCSI